MFIVMPNSAERLFEVIQVFVKAVGDGPDGLVPGSGPGCSKAG